MSERDELAKALLEFEAAAKGEDRRSRGERILWLLGRFGVASMMAHGYVVPPELLDLPYPEPKKPPLDDAL